MQKQRLNRYLILLERWALWGRGLLFAVILFFIAAFLFASRPHVVLPSQPFSRGVHILRITAAWPAFFFQHQLKARFESSRLADFDVALKSRLGHYRVESPELFLLPVNYRDEVMITVNGPATESLRVMDAGLDRKFLPGGWATMVFLSLAALFCHWLSHRLTAEKLYKAVLLVSSTGLSIFFLAVGLQFLEPSSRQKDWHLFPPFLDETLQIYPDVTPGIPPGFVHFKTNSEGIRARERGTNWSNTFSVLCIGASTTEGILLGEENHWPRLLEKKLQARGTNAWVGNAGHSGYSTQRLLTVASNYLPRLEPRVVILLTGFNEGIVPDLTSTAAETPNHDLATKAKTQLGRLVLARVLRAVLFSHARKSPNDVDFSRDNFGVELARQKCQRQAQLSPPVERKWEDLDLAPFQTSIRRIHALTHATGARLILCTQPALYRPDLTPVEQRLLWMMGNYTPESKRRRMDLINDCIRRMAKELQVTLVDLDRKLPRSTEVFYDDCHFNVAGAQRVAEAILPCFN